MATELIKTTTIGLTLDKYDFQDEFVLTGFPSRKKTHREWDSAYDFEKYVQKHFDCTGVEFDSESSQFFCYIKDKQKAIEFTQKIEDHFKKIDELLK